MGFAFKNEWYRRVGFAMLGAAGGFAYYYFVGCSGGACPISSNPYISTGYGALVGILVPWRKNSVRKPEQPGS